MDFHRGFRPYLAKPRLPVPFLMASFVVLIITAYLMTATDKTLDTELPVRQPTVTAVNLPGVFQQGEGTTFSFSGSLSSLALVDGVTKIKFLVGTYNRTLRLREGRLLVAGTPCEFRAHDRRVPDNSFIELSLESPCKTSSTEPATYQATLIFNEEMPTVAFWSVPFSAQPGLWFTAGLQQYFARTTFSRPSELVIARLPLLQFMWREAGPGVLVVLILSGLLALAAGTLLSLPKRSWRQIAGATTFTFFSFGLLYAAIIPPYQGPDEPDHFLALGKIENDPLFGEKSLDWGRHAYFREIKQLIARQFNAADTLQKLGGGWTNPNSEGVSETDMRARSPLTFAVWKVASWATGALPVEQQFLSLRLLNVVIVGCAFALFAFVCGAMGGTQGIIPMVMLLAPALPFFCMHVSNYPFYIAAHMISASGLVVMLAQPQGKPMGAGILGFAVAGAILASKIGVLLLVPTTLMLGAILGWSETLPARWSRSALGDLAKTLCAYGLGFFPLLIFWNRLSPDYLPERITGLHPSGNILVGAQFPLTLLVVASILGVLAVYATGCLREPVAHLLATLGGVARRLILGLCAVIFSLGVFTSHWVMPDIEQPVSFGVKRYLFYCLRTFVKDMGFAAPDFYLTTSFWAGFGWLDVPMPPWFVGGVSSLPLIFFVWLVWVKKKWDIREVLLGLTALKAQILYFLVFAFFAFSQRINLHGRYLTGFYVLYLLAAGLCAADLAKQRPKVKALLLRGLPTLAMAVHGISAVYILTRYFG